ncbi:hypothetical protein AB0E55_41650, partial [Amycolatopsis keratiniphila]|uniref:hypothetical protein n=1 Tax=Amycolatopsis keratiniphila TaxID=129921 RepID=UPI0034071DB0
MNDRRLPRRRSLGTRTRLDRTTGGVRRLAGRRLRGTLRSSVLTCGGRAASRLHRTTGRTRDRLPRHRPPALTRTRLPGGSGNRLRRTTGGVRRLASRRLRDTRRPTVLARSRCGGRSASLLSGTADGVPGRLVRGLSAPGFTRDRLTRLRGTGRG